MTAPPSRYSQKLSFRQAAFKLFAVFLFLHYGHPLFTGRVHADYAVNVVRVKGVRENVSDSGIFDAVPRADDIGGNAAVGLAADDFHFFLLRPLAVRILTVAVSHYFACDCFSLLTKYFFKVRSRHDADIRPAFGRAYQERAAALVMYDIVRFDFVDLSGFLVERAQIVHIVWREREDERVLRHVDNRH